MYNIGEINQLKVIRKTEIGYLLDGNNEEIFLHFNDSNYKDLKPGEIVDAFLYFDNKRRLAATLKTPLITKSSPSILEVVDKNDRLGLFLNMGINKDLLLSKDDLPFNKKMWPALGDTVYVSLVVKNNALVAKLVQPHEIILTEELTVGEDVDFIVQYIGDEGINLYNENHQVAFVHNSMYRGDYRIGEKVNARILNHTENGYTASLVKFKEILRVDDAEIILDYVRKNGSMPLTAKSSSEEVNVYFEMSRKAFKRALGLLYKEDKVKFSETETIYVKDGENNEW